MRFSGVLAVAAACSGGAGSPDAPSGAMGRVTLIGRGSNSLVQASFVYGSADPISGESCSTWMEGPCVVHGCQWGGRYVSVSAGTLSITGGAQPITLDPPYSLQLTSPPFAGGETLAVTASGADAPAFTATVTAASSATITSPAEPMGPFAIDRMQDLTIGWTGGTDVVVLAVRMGNSGSYRQITCTFDAAAGIGTIPSAAFPQGIVSMATYDFSTNTHTDTSVNGWEMRVTTEVPAFWPSGDAATGSAAP